MARNKATIDPAGALQPRDRIWTAIRALATQRAAFSGAALFSAAELALLVNAKAAPGVGPLHIDTVMKYLAALSRAMPPYVERYGEALTVRMRGELSLWRLARDVGVDAPRVNEKGEPVTDAMDQIWVAIKVLKEFDRVELAAAASTPACPLNQETVRRYLRLFERAGYVSVLAPCRREGLARSSLTRYRFNRARNSGPRAPIVREDKSLIDGNTGELVYTPSKGGRECNNPT